MEAISFVVLAAGAGVRMKSSLPKPLQKISNKTMLEMVVGSAKELHPEKLIVVVSDKRVEAAVSKLGGDVAWQEEPLGTADALRVALVKCGGSRDVIVTCVDTPMMTGKILKKAYDKHKKDNNYITVLTAEIPDPAGYGRVIKSGDKVLRIVEEKEATEDEKRIRLINGGIYCMAYKNLEIYLKKVKKSPVKGEYYLTDLVEIANRENLRVGEFSCDYKYIKGINNLVQLKETEELWSKKWKN